MRKGFTLIELIVVIAIMAIIATVAGLNLTGSRDKTDLTSTTQQIGTLLRQAQSDAMSEKQGTAWGVHFDNTTSTPYFALYASAVYSTSSINGGYYPLPRTVAYATATVPQGSAVNITFSAVTGAASAPASISLYVIGDPSISSTISISSAGAVNY